MVSTQKKKSGWRWAWRGIAALAVVMALVVAAGFLFTTQVVRWAVGRSAYAPFSPEIGSAALSADGELTLKNVVVHELAPQGAKVLVKAAEVRVGFAWWEIAGWRVRDITVDEATVYVRPGAREPGPAITLLELAEGSGGGGGALPMAAAAVGHDAPFWFDALACAGKVEVEAFEDMNIAAGSYPLKLTMAMRGDRGAPLRDLEVDIGAEGDKTQISGRLSFVPEEGAAEGERITIESCRARGLHAGISAGLAKRLPAGWPKMLQQALDGQVETFSADGTIDGLGGSATFKGKVAVDGAGIASQAGAANPITVSGIALSGSGGGPLGRAFVTAGTVVEGRLAIATAHFGKNDVEHLQMPVSLSGGKLEAADVKISFAGGDFSGRIEYSAATNRLISATFKVQHLDQKQVAANLAPDRIDGQGMLSGTIELTGGEKGGLSGTIDLTSDGPGRLQIKDEQTAEALAQKLQTGDVSGVLPPNFSDIVVQQLKDYPYKTAHIHLSEQNGVPVLMLDYARENIKAGEPGFGVQTTIGGQKVLANYTIQLPGVSVVLQGMSIEELLGRATGLLQQIASADTGK